MSLLFEILKPVVDFVISIISNLGYAGVIFLMVLDSAMIPIPSEIILVFSGYLNRLVSFLQDLLGMSWDLF
jgi:membrane protein DedA with SNARE-associated domain